jgi:hypothetical protein
MLCVLITLTACGGGGGSADSTSPSIPPPINLTPVFVGSNSFSIQENESSDITLQASDPEGEGVTFGLNQSGDATWFSMDAVTGALSIAPSIEFFDFENPRDSNGDNSYSFNVTISDGVNSIIETITVDISDQNGPLVCSSGETVTLIENKLGPFYTFEARKVDVNPQSILFGTELVITRAGTTPISKDFLHSTQSIWSGNYNIKDLTLSAFHIINAENEGNLEDVYTISTDASIDGEVVTCSVDVQIVDVINEVTSGIKFSGAYPNDWVMKAEAVGDLDGDGFSELWISSLKIIEGLHPSEHQGYLVFGESTNAELLIDGAEEMLVESFDANQAIKVSGSFPSVNGIDFTGNNLIASPIGDIDNDGISELLLTLQTPAGASANAFADRPLAYIIWGDSLFTNTSGEIDLNTLQPAKGLALEGLGGINRTGNTAISGDFDGDGIPDIAIGIPAGEMFATATSTYRGQIFIVFGSFVRTVKANGSIDLLEDIANINPEQILLLTAEDEFDLISEPPELPILSGAGSQILAFKDLDGDGKDELVTNGVNVEQFITNIGIVSSKALNSAKQGTGFLRYEDIPKDQLTIIKSRGGSEFQKKNGDVDADGIDDLIFIKKDYFSETPYAALIFGSALSSNNPGDIINIDTETPSADMVLFELSSGSTIQSASFLGDLDKDGRDDLIFSYLPLISSGNDTTGNGTVSIVLAKTLDRVTDDRMLSIEKLAAGEGLHIVNAAIKESGAYVSVLDDVNGDGDGLLSLSITPLVGKESYLIPGNDLLDAIQADSLLFDLDPRFRALDP